MVFPSRYVPLRVIDRIFCHLDRSAVEWRDLRSVLTLTAVTGHNDPTLCHLDRSAAQWRDLRSVLTLTAVTGHNDPTLCHLDRSAAQWRDLRSLIPLSSWWKQTALCQNFPGIFL